MSFDCEVVVSEKSRYTFQKGCQKKSVTTFVLACSLVGCQP